KEHGRLGQSRSRNPWRIACEVFAKLLGLVVQHWVLLVGCWRSADRSLRKAAPLVRACALHLASALACLERLGSALAVLVRGFAVAARVNKSRKKPRAFQILLGLRPADS
ncbi:MAG TPA: hypothetical protein VHK04_12550, partial [Castellaniella sp.]|nr:hypothetical protein [Castellaniella sp.]